MTEKRFTINEVSVLSDSQVLKILNQLLKENEQLIEALVVAKASLTNFEELKKENEQLKTRFHEEREFAMRLGRECDTLTIKKQELELEIKRLEEIIKTGKR